MTTPLSLLVVGAGHMGAALTRSWARSAALGGRKLGAITVVEPHPAAGLELGPNVRLVARPEALADGERFDAVVLAIKPQIMDRVAPAYGARVAPGGCFISIAAGVSLARLEDALPGAQIVRAMPNLPAAIDKGVIGLVGNGAAREGDGLARALDLMRGPGAWVETLGDEDALDRLTAIAGSGPGYVFALMEAYAGAAQELGLDAETARALTRHVFAGAVALADADAADPADLRAQVTSPNGTTQAGLAALNADAAVKAALTAAFQAALARARELAKS